MHCVISKGTITVPHRAAPHRRRVAGRHSAGGPRALQTRGVAHAQLAAVGGTGLEGQVELLWVEDKGMAGRTSSDGRDACRKVIPHQGRGGHQNLMMHHQHAKSSISSRAVASSNSFSPLSFRSITMTSAGE